MTQHKKLSIVLTVSFFPDQSCSMLYSWYAQRELIDPTRNPQYGSVPVGGAEKEEERKRPLSLSKTKGGGGEDKELFWASGNGELSEQKGSWQSRSDQGVFKVLPTLIFSSRPRWWNREAFCESPRRTLHVQGTIQALMSLVRWLNRQSQAGRRWRHRWSRGQACPPWSPPPSPPWLSHSSQFNHRPKTSPQMESKECNLYQNLCKWLPLPEGSFSNQGDPEMQRGEPWDSKPDYGREVQGDSCIQFCLRFCER